MPIPTLVLPGSSRVTTRLGFGCGTLMRIPRWEERDALLEAAFEAGIRHFDVARMYGLGKAEGELGRFLRGVSRDVTVGTKLGIDVGAGAALGGAQSALRTLFSSVPPLLALARRISRAAPPPKDFSAAAARASVARSLAELGVERVDLLMLHEPELTDLTDPALIPFLEELRANGTCSEFGVSANADEAVRIVERRPVLGRAIQVRNDVFGPRLDPVRRVAPALLGTFGVLHRALPTVRSYLAAHPSVVSDWSRKLDLDLGAAEGVAAALLACSGTESGGGLVLFSTTRAARIGPTARGFASLEDKSAALGDFASFLRDHAA